MGKLEAITVSDGKALAPIEIEDGGVIDIRGDLEPLSTHEVGEVPFLDLKGMHRQLEEEIIAVWRRLLRDASFIGGETVAAFEASLASYLGCRHAVGVASGTDAVMLALKGLGLRQGDEVITAANTFVGTIEGIVHAGGEPVLVDVDPYSATIDPIAVEAAVTDRTRFIVPVHLYGQPADMARIMDISTRHGLRVVEDNAQALGAKFREKPAGTLGDAAAISFYPGKNLGGAGDGGAVVTDDDLCADRVRELANHGQVRRNVHRAVGHNSRLDSLQAAVLSVKLPRLDGWNSRRRELAATYDRLLAPTELKLPFSRADAHHIYHLYVVRHSRRNDLAAFLADHRIETSLHYPTPIHLLPPFTHLGDGPGTFPNAEAWCRELLSLPMDPLLTDLQVEWVSSVIRDFFGRASVRARSLT